MKKYSLKKMIAVYLSAVFLILAAGCSNGNQNNDSNPINHGSIESNDENDSKEKDKYETLSDDEHKENDPEYELGKIVDSGICNGAVKWELDENGLLVISGSGVLSTVDDETMPWEEDGYKYTIRNVIIKRGITGFSIFSFLNEKSLETVVLPDTLIEIPNRAFHSCTALKKINIPDSVTSIGEIAFQDCDSLTNIVIPSSVTSIGSQAFSNCIKLTDIQVDAENPKYASVDGVLFNKSKTELITYPGGKSAVYDVPENVTSIADGAFEGTAWYDSQPDGDVYAGKVYYRYKGEMSENTSLSIKNGTKGIAGGAFRECKGLINISIPEGVTNIGEGAFAKCSELINVNIPDGVQSIEDYAFVLCDKLENITIPNSVKSIGRSAFYGCKGLAKITIPDNVNRIDSNVFRNCTELTDIYVGKDNAKYTSVDGVLFDKSKKELIFYPQGKSGNYIIPDGVEYIYENAFCEFTEPTRITIPDSVTIIEDYSFTYKDNLTIIGSPGSYAETFALQHSIPFEVKKSSSGAPDKDTVLETMRELIAEYCVPDSISMESDEDGYIIVKLDADFEDFDSIVDFRYNLADTGYFKVLDGFSVSLSQSEPMRSHSEKGYNARLVLKSVDRFDE